MLKIVILIYLLVKDHHNIQYFNKFTKIYYDVAQVMVITKLVTNLLRRVQIKEGLKESGALFDMYDVGGEETTESVSEQFYGDQKYYWIILLFNNVKDRFYDNHYQVNNLKHTSMTSMIDVNGIHHYEVTQESGAQTSFDNSHTIQVNSTTSGATGCD